jgi:hypothetical protein
LEAHLTNKSPIDEEFWKIMTTILKDAKTNEIIVEGKTKL